MKSPFQIVNEVVQNIRTLLHDLKNLVAIIQGQQELIQEALRTGDTETAMRLLAKSQETVMRMQKTTQSAVEARIPVSVNALIQSIADELKPQDVRFSFDFHRGDARVYIKYTDLYRALVNIWKNAIEAMEGLPKPKEIRAETLRGTPETFGFKASDFGGQRKIVGIRVWNNGTYLTPDPALPASPFEYLFTPGFSTKGGENRGLGLASVRNIVKGNGGYIKVKNEPTGGVSFFFFFPEHDDGQPVQ